MSSASALPKSAVVLRFQRPAVFPSVAKMLDASDLHSLQTIAETVPVSEENQPYMYFEKESIREEENNSESEEELDYTKRKKREEQRRRNRLRPKTQLCLSNPSKSVNLEGTATKLDLADSEDISLATIYRQNKSANSKSANANGSNGVKNIPDDFRYCIFQFVEREQDGQVFKEVHVTPMDKFYTMRKSSTAPDLLLEEAEERVVQEQAVLRQRMVKTHRRLIKAIVHNDEIARAQRAEDNNEDEFNEFGKSTNKSGKSKDAIDDKNLTEDERLERKFQLTINNAFAKSLNNSKQSKGGRNKSSNFNGDDKQYTVKLNDVGYAEDELHDDSEQFKGDFGGRFVDDEEANVDTEQAQTVADVDREYGESWRREQDDQLDVEDDEDADSDEERGGAEGGVGGGSGTSGNGEEVKGSGFVDDKLVDAAKASKMANAGQVAATIAEEAALKSATISSSKADGSARKNKGEVSSGAAMTKSALKRGADLTASGGDGVNNNRKRVRISTDGDRAAVALDYDLNDDGLRRYITNNGGLVNALQTFKFFKPKMDEYNRVSGDRRSGSERFIDITTRITVQVEDATLGTCLKLKA